MCSWPYRRILSTYEIRIILTHLSKKYYLYTTVDHAKSENRALRGLTRNVHISFARPLTMSRVWMIASCAIFAFTDVERIEQNKV